MFLESILFLKNWKFQKTVLPCFGDSVAGKSSRLPQCELTSQFWQLVRKWKVQSQWVHRDFCSSTRDSLASETSNREKHLEIFSKLLAWSVLAGVSGDYLATYLSREKCVFCTVRAIFKIFFSFPSNFFWLFIFSFVCNFPNTPCNPLRSPLLLLFNSKSSRKRYGFSFSHSVFLVFVLFPLDYLHYFFWFELGLCFGCCSLSVLSL